MSVVWVCEQQSVWRWMHECGFFFSLSEFFNVFTWSVTPWCFRLNVAVWGCDGWSVLQSVLMVVSSGCKVRPLWNIRTCVEWIETLMMVWELTDVQYVSIKDLLKDMWMQPLRQGPVLSNERSKSTWLIHHHGFAHCGVQKAYFWFRANVLG